MESGGVASSGPLRGIRVIDFSRIVSGPFATQILGDLGADVIKVEFLGTGDEVRAYGLPQSAEARDVSVKPGSTFVAMNRNKRSIALDIRTDRGREIAARLIDGADIVVENFRTGVMDRLGIGYEASALRNPGIIYCSISGFGTVGPLRTSPANDLVVQAHTGLLSITGERGGLPVRNPTPVCDMTAGLYVVIGSLAALQARSETGRGQRVETNMYEGQLNMLNYMFVDYWRTGIEPVRMGTRNKMGQPNEAFPTSDGWICIIAANQAAWNRFCAAIGREELATDERFCTLADRLAHPDELYEEISKATRAMSTADCERCLQEARVPCAPVNTFGDVTAHPQFAAIAESGGVVEMPVGELGNVPLVMSPLHLSGDPITARRSPPMLGEHTDELLTELGLSGAEIEDLRREGIAE
jgi:crotonobetainyl-CoA:carnitine CoA-transferase CaiB-like acyl-CoA transferase